MREKFVNVVIMTTQTPGVRLPAAPGHTQALLRGQADSLEVSLPSHGLALGLPGGADGLPRDLLLRVRLHQLPVH